MANFTVTVIRNGKHLKNARVRIWGARTLDGYREEYTNEHGQANFNTGMSSGQIYVNGDLKNNCCGFKGEVTVHLWSNSQLSQISSLGFFLLHLDFV